MMEIKMVEISLMRYAELAITEDKFNRLCEILKERGWRGLSGEEVRFIRDMLGVKEEVESE